MKIKIKWGQIEKTLRIVEVIAITGALIFAGVQLKELKNSQSAQLMLTFNNELNSDLNANLITAIEEGFPIFKENNGKFTTTDVDRYLGAYELLNRISIVGLISDDMLYNAFAYSIVKTYQNEEIQDYLEKIRKEDSAFFLGFEELAEDILWAEELYKN